MQAEREAGRREPYGLSLSTPLSSLLKSGLSAYPPARGKWPLSSYWFATCPSLGLSHQTIRRGANNAQNCVFTLPPPVEPV